MSRVFRAMARHVLIAVLASTATLSAGVGDSRAQQGERVRHIGVLTGVVDKDSEIQARMAAFSQELQQAGWVEGRNLKIELRGSAGDPAVTRKYAAEVVALRPDVILAIGNVTVAPLLEATRSVPIVFTVVIDPVGAGFVESLSRPGGNVTGFMMFEYSLSGKWLDLLKEIAPGVKRAAVLREPTSTAGIGQFAVIQAVAPQLGIEVNAINVRDPGEIERAVDGFVRIGNVGLVVTANPGSTIHRDLTIKLAARHNLPAVYFGRTFVIGGGLISYGPDLVEQTRQAGTYVARILKGEKPADLPVQAPTKYDLVINLKTAKALGIDIPPTLLARADEVIE